MFQASDYPDQNLLTLTIAGTLTKADYDGVVPTLEQKVARYGKINVYLEVRSLDMITLPALWQDIKQDVKHYNDFNRVAVASDDNTLIKGLAAASNLLAPIQVRHFPLAQKEEAVQWALGEELGSAQAKQIYAS
ncbi:STAS/SEC14 domain-containing protein [Hymenobacter sp. GOD-10R]|uniref:STAS/SEC14 domain-containing protein n=1 Tax=Hymenobacter sp. GOD-10R TaxID=3093922 RepID=UPI002D76BD30|nr:STAS/SEC14 domain-containing protein [Hymenobacter sp. GOD-10R]WRQ30605.1 STAS/SEC14 domain-containing protein [Hymenobacter sp. GOD-10R]